MSRRIALLVLSCLALAGSAAAAEAPFDSTIYVGGDVQVSKPVEGPVHALGGNVSIEAPVNGDVWVAGGEVRLASTATVAGDVSAAGGDVTIEGPTRGDLNVAGGDVRIDGPVSGDASIAAGTLELGPGARIQGKLHLTGGDLRRDPAAQVLGGVDYTRHRWHGHERTATERFLHGWIWTLGLVLLAALIAAALPEASRRMAQELEERPWLTALLGLVALVSIPIAAALLIITIIGIPVGLLAIVGYVALILVGYVWVAVVVGGMLLDRVNPQTAARTAWRVGAAVLTMLALAVLVRVPFVGGFVKLAALAVGVGMIVAVVFRHSTPPTQTRTA